MFVKDFSECQKMLEYPTCNPSSKTLFSDLAHPQIDQITIGYSFAHFRLEPGARTVKFRFKNTSDLILVVEGSASLQTEDGDILLSEWQLALIPPGKERVIVNTGKKALIFLSIAEPAFSPEDIEILEEAKFEKTCNSPHAFI